MHIVKGFGICFLISGYNVLINGKNLVCMVVIIDGILFEKDEKTKTKW